MFELNFCEYNRSNADCDTIYRPEGREDYLFLLFKTPMKVRLREELEVTKQNACLFYTPGVCQHYQAVKRFRNSYVHFTCGENPAARFGVPQNQVFYPDNYEEIDSFLKLLQQEYLSRSPFCEEYAYALVKQLFISIARSLRQEKVREGDPENVYPSFQKIRFEMLSRCEEDWSIERLCTMANMGKSQFYAYYREFFDNTPKNELLQVRLEKAKNLLGNEALQVKQIAGMCGFTNLAHFTRYFKKNFGCPPSEYVKNCSY